MENNAVNHQFWVVLDDGSEETWTTNRDLRGALGDLAERLRFIPNYKNVRHKASITDPCGEGFDVEII